MSALPTPFVTMRDALAYADAIEASDGHAVHVIRFLCAYIEQAEVADRRVMEQLVSLLPTRERRRRLGGGRSEFAPLAPG